MNRTFNETLFKIAVIKAGYTYSTLAREWGKPHSTLIRKIKKQNFFIRDVSEIAVILNLSDDERDKIFFGNECA